MKRKFKLKKMVRSLVKATGMAKYAIGRSAGLSEGSIAWIEKAGDIRLSTLVAIHEATGQDIIIDGDGGIKVTVSVEHKSN